MRVSVRPTMRSRHKAPDKTIATVSAPTARAVRLAESLNVTLIGFLRKEACVIYTESRCLSELGA